MDYVYWERNQLILFLTKIFPSCVGIDHDALSPWKRVVFIDTPEGQLSWHIHDDEIEKYFSHLESLDISLWDGHTTEEKYERLSRLNPVKDS